MRKGLTKITTLLLALTIIVSPFLYSNNIKAQFFNDNIGFINAVNYFKGHGLETVAQTKSDISITWPYYTFDQYYNSSVKDYDLMVYRNADNAYLGYYINSSNNAIYYRQPSDTTAVRTCTDCYIKLDGTGTGIMNDEIDVIPWYAGGNTSTENQDLYIYMKGTYRNDGQYITNNRNYVLGGSKTLLMYAIPNDHVGNNAAGTIINNIGIYTDNVNITKNDFDISCNRRIFGGYVIVTITLTPNTTINFTLDLGNFNNKNCTEIIPLYYGLEESMPTELVNYIYGNTNLKILDAVENLVNGNTGTNSAVNNANSTNNQLSNTTSSYETIDAELTSNVNSNLQNVNTNLNVNNLSGFVYGANWVKTQFDFITSYEPINLIVSYALILGLAMLILGKRLF